MGDRCANDDEPVNAGPSVAEMLEAIGADQKCVSRFSKQELSAKMKVSALFASGSASFSAKKQELEQNGCGDILVDVRELQDIQRRIRCTVMSNVVDSKEVLQAGASIKLITERSAEAQGRCDKYAAQLAAGELTPETYNILCPRLNVNVTNSKLRASSSIRLKKVKDLNIEQKTALREQIFEGAVLSATRRLSAMASGRGGSSNARAISMVDDAVISQGAKQAIQDKLTVHRDTIDNRISESHATSRATAQSKANIKIIGLDGSVNLDGSELHSESLIDILIQSHLKTIGMMGQLVAEQVHAELDPDAVFADDVYMPAPRDSSAGAPADTPRNKISAADAPRSDSPAGAPADMPQVDSPAVAPADTPRTKFSAGASTKRRRKKPRKDGSAALTLLVGIGALLVLQSLMSRRRSPHQW